MIMAPARVCPVWASFYGSGRIHIDLPAAGALIVEELSAPAAVGDVHRLVDIPFALHLEHRSPKGKIGVPVVLDNGQIPRRPPCQRPDLDRNHRRQR